MKTRITSRLLAAPLILCVGLFALQAAGHWHGRASDEQHCQVCHVGRHVAPQPVARVMLAAPLSVARFSPNAETSAEFETLCTHRSPRAPPV